MRSCWGSQSPRIAFHLSPEVVGEASTSGSHPARFGEPQWLPPSWGQWRQPEAGPLRGDWDPQPCWQSKWQQSGLSPLSKWPSVWEAGEAKPTWEMYTLILIHIPFRHLSPEHLYKNGDTTGVSKTELKLSLLLLCSHHWLTYWDTKLGVLHPNALSCKSTPISNFHLLKTASHSLKYHSYLHSSAYCLLPGKLHVS